MKHCIKTLSTLGAILAIISIIAAPASAAITWSGTAGGDPPVLTWATSPAGGNWTGGVEPGSADDVIFGNTGASGTVGATTNDVTSNVTINSLWFGQRQPNYQTTQIEPGVTLKISGTAADPTGMTGTGTGNVYSLIAGTAEAGGADGSDYMINQTVIKGGGALDISNSTGGNTGGDIIVRQTSPAAGGGTNPLHNSILDLSGLTSFNANVDQLLIGYSTSSGNNNRPMGKLYLAQNNTITLNNTDNSGSSAALVISSASSNNNSNSGVSYLYLGQHNTINVPVMLIGTGKCKGIMQYNPAISGADLTIRNSDGTSRATAIRLGDMNNSASNPVEGTLDLTGVTADILVDQILVGRTTTSGTNTSAAKGTLKFNAGTIDVNTLSISKFEKDGSLNPVSGSVTVGGGLLKVHTNLILSSFTGTSSVSSAGTLTINGGTVLLDCDITEAGGTSTLQLKGGTLNLQGHNIGSGANLIDAFTLESGTLKNVAEINGGAGITKTTGGTLTIDGTNTYSGLTTVQAGKILAEGSLTSSVDVKSGAFLGGSGSIGGLTVEAGGTLTAGNSPGTLTVNGAASLGGDDLVEIMSANPSTGYDALAVNGSVALGGTLTIAKDVGFSPDPATDKFWIVLNDLDDSLVGTFTNYADGAEVFNDAGNSWTIHYGANSASGNVSGGNDVVIAVVPEPAALAMLLIAAALGLIYRRKK